MLHNCIKLKGTRQNMTTKACIKSPNERVAPAGIEHSSVNCGIDHPNDHNFMTDTVVSDNIAAISISSDSSDPSAAFFATVDFTL